MDEPHIITTIVVACLVLILGIFVYRRRSNERPPVLLDQWFTVGFDDERVTLDVRPPGGTPSLASFRWSEVTRVCFKPEHLTISDGLYIFTTQRPESFAVPTEAKGGAQFWADIVERELFPADLAIQAASSPEGEMVCWPPLTR